MASLNGKWKLFSMENFEDYLKAISSSPESTEMALKLLTPENDIVQEISIEGSKVTMKVTTPAGSMESSAELGKEQSQKSLDGRELTVVYTLDGDVLTETQTGGYSSENVRKVEGDVMIMTMKSGNTITTRKYKKQ